MTAIIGDKKAMKTHKELTKGQKIKAKQEAWLKAKGMYKESKSQSISKSKKTLKKSKGGTK